MWGPPRQTLGGGRDLLTCWGSGRSELGENCGQGRSLVSTLRAVESPGRGWREGGEASLPRVVGAQGTWGDTGAGWWLEPRGDTPWLSQGRIARRALE